MGDELVTLTLTRNEAAFLALVASLADPTVSAYYKLMNLGPCYQEILEDIRATDMQFVHRLVHRLGYGDKDCSSHHEAKEEIPNES